VTEDDTRALADIEALRAWLAAPAEPRSEEEQHAATVAKQLSGLPGLASVIGQELADAIAAARAAAGVRDPMCAELTANRAAEMEAAMLLRA
jgi:hypothetical protein